MIPDETERKILHLHFVDEWNVATIAKQVGVHHTTVRRVLQARGLSPKLAIRPSQVDPYLPFIKETLAKWPTLTASRLYDMAVERGYRGSRSHFRRIIGRIRPPKPAVAFQRLSTLPAEQAQADWAHCGKVTIGRATRAVSAFVLVLSWSRMPFVRFFYDQRLGTFLHAHRAAFEALGGVPRIVLYDNLKAVVAERRGDAIRFNPTMLAFAAHYRFEPRPVAPYRGNEKGRVERRIRDLRSSFLAGRTWHNLDDLNAQVDAWCHDVAGGRSHPDQRTRTVASMFVEERPQLRALPDDRFPTHDRVEVKVGKTPYIRFDGNDYSVPHDRVRRRLVVLATPARVRILDGDEEVAAHDRSFDRGAQIEDAAHLQALANLKRRARKGRGMDRLRHAVPASDRLLKGAADRGHNLGSAVAGLLRLLDTWGADRVEAAVQECLRNDALHVAAVRQVLEQRAEAAGTPPPIEVELPNDPKVRDVHVRPHDLDDYDDLGGDHGQG